MTNNLGEIQIDNVAMELTIIPNIETISAMKEARTGSLQSAENIEQFIEAMQQLTALE